MNRKRILVISVFTLLMISFILFIIYSNRQSIGENIVTTENAITNIYWVFLMRHETSSLNKA